MCLTMPPPLSTLLRVEFLTHDISVHVPHHVSSKIPWYNLRAANDSLRKNWGDYMCECDFNLRMLRNIFTECHIYDKVRRRQSLGLGRLCVFMNYNNVLADGAMHFTHHP